MQTKIKNKEKERYKWEIKKIRLRKCVIGTPKYKRNEKSITLKQGEATRVDFLKLLKKHTQYKIVTRNMRRFNVNEKKLL